MPEPRGVQLELDVARRAQPARRTGRPRRPLRSRTGCRRAGAPSARAPRGAFRAPRRARPRRSPSASPAPAGWQRIGHLDDAAPSTARPLGAATGACGLAPRRTYPSPVGRVSPWGQIVSEAGTRAVGRCLYRDVVAKAAAIQHACTECGTTSGRWLGRCPGCGEFGTMELEALPQRGGSPGAPLVARRGAAAPGRRRGRGGRPDLDRRAGARPRARRRARPGLARARRRRARRRQVDPPARRARRDLARPPRAARDRRGVGRAGQAAGGAARRLRRRGDPRRDRTGRGVRDARARAPCRLRDRLGADALVAGGRFGARAPSPRCARRPRGCCGSRRSPASPRSSSAMSRRTGRSRGRACSSISSTACCSSRATATTRTASCAP